MRHFKWLCVATTVIAYLALPGIASADTGAITNVFANGDGTINATYTTTSTCAGEPARPYDCGWWPHAVQGSASLPCYQYTSGDGRLTYVGGNGDDIWIGPNTDIDSDYFYPDWNPVRICLYVNYGGENRILVAEYVYPGGPAPAPAPPPAPAPAPAPAPQPAPVAPMSIREAKAELPGVLRKRFGRRFNRRTLSRSCYRLTSEKVRCRVVWRKKPRRYVGSVTMRNDPADPADSFLYHVKVKGKRIRVGAASISSLAAQAVAERAALR